VETSEVTFRAFDDSVIEAYFEEVDPLDKAGGYAIQTRPDLIIDKFTGSHSNVIGLPLELLGSWLTELGIT
jgi:septum formation protein